MELNFRKKKVLLFCSYNPYKNLLSNHLNILGKRLASPMKIYEDFLIAGDFNSEMTDSAMEKFCVAYHLHNLSKDPACFKNPDQPSCIDLLLTNFSKSFLKFRTELLSAMERHSNISFADFHSEFLYLLGKHAPVQS